MTALSAWSGAHIGCTRRRFIQVGGGGLFGLSLPGLLWAGESGAENGTRRQSEKSCIFIVLSGGPSHIDTLDPKPDTPAEIRGPYQPIATRTPGVRLSEMLPRLAELSQHYCLLRSLSHGDGVHVTAAHTMLTGQHDGSRRNDSPFMGSLIAKLRPATANMPSYVWVHNMKTGTRKVPRYNSGLGKIGHGYAPLRIGHELDNAAAPDFRVREFDPPEDVSPTQLARRLRLLDAIEAQPSAASGTAVERFGVFQRRARDLITGPAARRAFDLKIEPEKVRDRYGRHPLGQYVLLARRLIEAGVRLAGHRSPPPLRSGRLDGRGHDCRPPNSP